MPSIHAALLALLALVGFPAQARARLVDPDPLVGLERDHAPQAQPPVPLWTRRARLGVDLRLSVRARPLRLRSRPDPVHRRMPPRTATSIDEPRSGPAWLIFAGDPRARRDLIRRLASGAVTSAYLLDTRDDAIQPWRSSVRVEMLRW